MRHGNTNCDAPTQPLVLCSRSKPILYTHTQVANLDILQPKKYFVLKWKVFGSRSDQTSTLCLFSQQLSSQNCNFTRLGDPILKYSWHSQHELQFANPFCIMNIFLSIHVFSMIQKNALDESHFILIAFGSFCLCSNTLLYLIIIMPCRQTCMVSNLQLQSCILSDYIYIQYTYL